MIEKMTEVEIKKFHLTALHKIASGVDRSTIVMIKIKAYLL